MTMTECPKCGKSCYVSDEEVGRSFVCRSCGQEFVSGSDERSTVAREVSQRQSTMRLQCLPGRILSFKCVLAIAGMTALATVLAFPRTTPALVVAEGGGGLVGISYASSGEKQVNRFRAETENSSAKVNYVTLTFAFGYKAFGYRGYCLRVSPDVRAYEKMGERVIVTGPTPDEAGFFPVYYATENTDTSRFQFGSFDPVGSFSLPHWLLLNLLPSTIIGVLLTLYSSRRRKTTGNNCASTVGERTQ